MFNVQRKQPPTNPALDHDPDPDPDPDHDPVQTGRWFTALNIIIVTLTCEECHRVATSRMTAVHNLL